MIDNVKRGSRFSIIDALVILLHITYGMSMLKVWLLDPIPLRGHYILFFITTIVYFIRFGFSFKLITAKHNLVVWLLIIIYIADIIQCLFFNIEQAIPRLFFLLDVFIFMSYVYSMYLDGTKSMDNPVINVTKYYECYNVYNIVVVLLCLSLIIIGVLSARDNPLYTNSLIDSNVEAGGQYYFPGHLSLAIDSQRGLAVFDLPVLTGLTHEPHVLFLFLGPCFFLFLIRVLNRPSLSFWLYILFFALLIIATSASAIIAFLMVFVVDQLYNVFIGENKGKNLFVFIVILGALAIFMSKGGLIVEDISDMMDNKLGATDDVGSKGFSMMMLYYLITPHALLGRGNMPEGTGFELIGQDIGYVTCVFDLLFLLLFLIKSVKFVISKDRQIHYYGMMFLYFFIHNLKMSVQSFNYQYISFFVVLIVIVNNVLDSRSKIDKRISSKHIKDSKNGLSIQSTRSVSY